VQNICRSLFADATPEEAYPVLLKLLQLGEAPYDTLPSTGFSADYVRRETERAVAGVNGKCRIYPGIDLDIPTRPRASTRRDKPVDALGTTGIGGGDIPDDVELAQCTRDGVKAAVLAAFAGGAQGVVLSRKYSEMRLDILSGAGDAIRELS
jgi:hypothetical protein